MMEKMFVVEIIVGKFHEGKFHKYNQSEITHLFKNLLYPVYLIIIFYFFVLLDIELIISYF